MGRAIFDDITPPSNFNDDDHVDNGDHSIRDITPPDTKERAVRRAKRAERRKIPKRINRVRNKTSLTKTRIPFGKVGIWIIAVIFVIVAFFIFGFAFISKTTILIVPKQENLTLSSTVILTAYKKVENGELGYFVLPYSIEASDTIAATGKENVQQKATGKIVVYNKYSSARQRLIKNTRFESSDGNIYRVRNPIMVPGKKKDGTPGSIEITVFADKSGANQNMSNIGAKFTIPGLKGDKRFNSFYASLKTPITGGYSGERAIVDKDVLSAARANLRAKLKSEVVAMVKKKAPTSMVVFNGGIFTSFESKEITYGKDSTAIVHETAKIYAVAFDKDKLARSLANAAIATPPGGTISIDSPNNISMNIINKDGVDIINDALIQFTLSGKTRITWQVDIKSLKQDLVGKNSSALNSIMSSYPGIKTGRAKIRPPWRKVFPSNTGNISVEILENK